MTPRGLIVTASFAEPRHTRTLHYAVKDATRTLCGRRITVLWRGHKGLRPSEAKACALCIKHNAKRGEQ
jgi:hypothetical protein